MKKSIAGRLITLAALPSALLSSAAAADTILPGEEPIMFTASSEETVPAYRGTVRVPENRADPSSRVIDLSYVRFPATDDAKGPPIIYLSGGPGGSGSRTAKGRRFPLFMEMRQHGDVIAFDQRGTGASTQLPRCRSSIMVSETEPSSDADYADAYRRAARECAAFWREEGVAIEGYTTSESVRDLSSLRKHLGAEQMTLWGISYGSHLSLAALNQIPEEIDRVIIASAEGLDQTVKLPSRTAAYFRRLQSAVDDQPAAAAAYPDIIGLMARVHSKLETAPLMLDVPQRDGTTMPFLLQRRDVQSFASGIIADPDSVPILLALYAQLDAGETELAAMLVARFLRLGEPVTLWPMSTAMDRASGITAERMARFERETNNSPIGSYLNFPMPHIAGELTDLDLGDSFRSGPEGDTPVMLITGTLDGRTYVEGQIEAVAGLSNVTQITVHNAGHNVFMTSPLVAEAMHSFMREERLERTLIQIPAPDFTELPPFR